MYYFFFNTFESNFAKDLPSFSNFALSPSGKGISPLGTRYPLFPIALDAVNSFTYSLTPGITAA